MRCTGCAIGANASYKSVLMPSFLPVDDDPMLIAKKISLLKNINILKFDKCGL
jgi:hypothetical protein